MKRKILLDLSVPRPPASAFPTASQDNDIPHLTLDSHNGSVTGEVWLLRAKPESARERAHLHFLSHNGSVKALVVRKLPPSLHGTGRLELICSLVAHPPVDGRASPVPQHRS